MAYNASQQKSPVCYDLEESHYKAYHFGYMFHFSTVAHRDKFLLSCKNKVDWLNDSMSRRFHVPCSFARLALVQLYMQIEGRGFYIYDEHEAMVYRSPDDLKLVIDLIPNVEDDVIN